MVVFTFGKTKNISFCEVTLSSSLKLIKCKRLTGASYCMYLNLSYFDLHILKMVPKIVASLWFVRVVCIFFK